MTFDDDRSQRERGRPMAGGSGERPWARGQGSPAEGRAAAYSPETRGGAWNGGVWRDPATPATWRDAPARGDWGRQGGATADLDQGRLSAGGYGTMDRPGGNTGYGEYGGGEYGGGEPGAWGRQGGTAGGSAGVRRGPKNWQRSDERIREDLCDRLAGLEDVDSAEVEVAVEGGCVTLSGTVPDRATKHRVEDCADGCPGVVDVDNHLRVRRPRDPASRGGLMSRLFGFTSGADVRDVMTPDPMVVAPSDTVEKAARLMRDADVGAIPVCEGPRLQGMLTDRDITVRVVAEGRAPQQVRVSEAMSGDVFSCWVDDDIDDVLEKMGDRQVRRIPVLDRESRALVGIVSLGDVATATGKHTDDALQAISTDHGATGASSGGTRVTIGSSAGLSSGTTSGVNSGI